MAYQFTNRTTGKSQITDDSDAAITLNGINTTTTDANVIMSGLTQLLGLVGWTIKDANRVVTQDIEEVQ